MKTAAHFVDKNMLNPTNPLTVNLIGAGGTGSHLLTALARMNHALTALGHAGLYVQVIDDDRVTEANLGRQLFAESELGQYKAAALVSRINRFFGTNWRAIPQRFSVGNEKALPNHGKASIYLSCVDTAEARFTIARYLRGFRNYRAYDRDRPRYWLDFGNSQHSGQVVLSTIGEIKQPHSEKFAPVADLPFVTDLYADLLADQPEDDQPSCSLAEALTKQDLFINGSLADLGASLLWSMFREGILLNKGFFLNLKDFRTQPLKVA